MNPERERENRGTKVSQPWQRSEIRPRREESGLWVQERSVGLISSLSSSPAQCAPVPRQGNWQRQARGATYQIPSITSQGIIDSSAYTCRGVAQIQHVIMRHACTNRAVCISSCALQAQGAGATAGVTHAYVIISKSLALYGLGVVFNTIMIVKGTHSLKSTSSALSTFSHEATASLLPTAPVYTFSSPQII